MRPVESFLDALESDKWSEVLDVVNRHHLRKDNLNIEEFLQTLPKRLKPRLCDALSGKAIQLVGQFRQLLEEAEQEPDAGAEADDSENKRLSLYTDLRALVLLLRVSLEECREGPLSAKLLPAVGAVHSVLLALEEDASLQDSAARLCEAWWAQNLSGREQVMAQTIPYLLARALDNGKAADVHRVFAVRQAVPMFDFADESIESLKKLLLRSAFAPPFLRSAEGKRFITYLCGLNAGMVREIFAIVRNQIPSGRKSILETYGEILFKAWKVASGPCLYELEYNCVQRLMEACLYASAPSLAGNIRRVLGGFHSQKKQRGVDELLLRLYEPLLFRALQVANVSVRHNALLLFVDVFPLQNPDAPHDQTDELLQKQIGLLDKLLSDPAPSVRASAVEGVCRILRVFWELIPSQTTAKLIARLVEEMSYDGASSAVRSAVLDGVTYLLHNPLSHSLVKAVLPRLAPMINDTIPKVRLAAVDLLLAVRNIKSLDRGDERSNQEALLKSLAMAEPPVARKLTRLLLRTYVPAHSPVSEAAEKLFALIKQDPSAGTSFCRHMQEEGVPSDIALQIAGHLCNTVTESPVAVGPVNAKRASRSRVSKRKAGTDITNGAPPEKQSMFVRVEEQEGILEAVVALAKGAVGARIDLDVLVAAFPSSLLIALLDKAASGVARSSVLRLAGVLPPSEIPALIQHCATRLASAGTPESDPTACDEVRAILSFITSWGGLPDLSGALAAALAGGSSSPTAPIEPTPIKGRKRGRKKGASAMQDRPSTPTRDHDTDAMTPGAAAHYVELLLEDETSRASLLDNPDSVNALFEALRETVQWALQSPNPTPNLPAIIRAYAKLVIHWALFSQTHSEDVNGADSESWSTSASAFQELVSWSKTALEAQAETKILGLGSALKSGDTPQPKRTRSRPERGEERGEGTHVGLEDALLTVLMLCGDAVALGLLPAKDADDGSVALRFAAAFVRQTHGRAKASKRPSGDVIPLLKSALSHAAKLTQVWPESEGPEKADLADAILTVAATCPPSEPPADTCPTPPKPKLSSPGDKPATSSASKRASPVIAFGHRVEFPGSKEESPEIAQSGRVSKSRNESLELNLVHEATAVQKPWLESLVGLTVREGPGFGVLNPQGANTGGLEEGGREDRTGMVGAERSGKAKRGPEQWFDMLLGGWVASTDARHSPLEEPGTDDRGSGKLETAEGGEGLVAQIPTEESIPQLPPLLETLFEIAGKSSGPVKGCLAETTALALLKSAQGGAFHKASKAAQLLARLSGGQRGSLRPLLTPSVSERLQTLLQNPEMSPLSDASNPADQTVKVLRTCLQNLMGPDPLRNTVPEATGYQWETSW